MRTQPIVCGLGAKPSANSQAQPPPPPPGWLSGPLQGGFVIMSPEPDQNQRV